MVRACTELTLGQMLYASFEAALVGYILSVHKNPWQCYIPSISHGYASCWPNASLMLGQCRRRWFSIWPKTASGQLLLVLIG